MRIASFLTLLTALALFVWAKAPETGVGSKLPDGYRAVSLSCWWYDVAKAAVRGQKGIHQVSMLLRRNPFGEWVVVYYDPEKTSEAKILKRVRTNGCRNSAIVRAKQKSTTMNPFVAAGDVVQLRLNLAEKTSLTISKIPTGWKLEGKLNELPAGEHYLNVRVPKRAQQKRSQIILKTDRDESFSFSVEVVGLVRG